MQIEMTQYDSEADEERTVSFPAKWVICTECEGHGSRLRAGMRNHCYTQEEFNEGFWDPEDRAEYFQRGGIYDESCSKCGATGKVKAVDESKLTVDQKRAFLKKEADEAEAVRLADERTMRIEDGIYD